LWRLFDEVKDLYDAPGFKMSPTGRPAEDPNGDPAEDTNVKLQAAELELKVLESLRKLDARDRPQRTHVTVDVARQQADAALAAVAAKIDADRREMERLRRAAVIPGEVVRELEV
jgi:cytochrome c553